MDQKTIIVIADAHLGTTKGDVEQLIEFICSFEPKRHELLFLGDLFHIWAGPLKYRTAIVNSLMEVLFSFREKGGVSYLVAGNRDAFLPEKQSQKENDIYPFEKIALDLLKLQLPGGELIAVHGDTINRQDKQYLRWRALIRSKPFRWSFNLIPANRVKRILLMLEENLKKTNLAFRKEFPEEEWLRFRKNMYDAHSPKLLLAGHYHPKEAVVDVCGSMTAMIVPAWCDDLSYLEIKEDLTATIRSVNSKQHSKRL